MIIIMGAVIGWPLIQTFVLSLTDSDLMNLSKPAFVGFTNFTKALKNPGYLESLKISGLFALVVVLSEMVLGTSVALLLNEPFKGRAFVRGLLILRGRCPPPSTR